MWHAVLSEFGKSAIGKQWMENGDVLIRNSVPPPITIFICSYEWTWRKEGKEEGRKGGRKSTERCHDRLSRQCFSPGNSRALPQWDQEIKAEGTSQPPFRKGNLVTSRTQQISTDTCSPSRCSEAKGGTFLRMVALSEGLVSLLPSSFHRACRPVGLNPLQLWFCTT